MKKYIRTILYGFMAWLIPFVISFSFYSKDGLTIDIFLFKSIMIVTGSISGAVLLISYFQKIKTAFFREGIQTGVIWFLINIILDLTILLPMSGMSIADYFTQIGIRYLVIPAMSVAVGKSLENKKEAIPSNL